MENLNENQVVKFETDDFYIHEGETIESLSKKYDVKITKKGINKYKYMVYEIEGKYENVIKLYNGDHVDREWLKQNCLEPLIKDYMEKHPSI